MTAKQEEAIELIRSLNDDQLSALIRQIKNEEESAEARAERRKRKFLDFESYSIRTERGQRADDYVRELRANDRN